MTGETVITILADACFWVSGYALAYTRYGMWKHRANEAQQSVNACTSLLVKVLEPDTPVEVLREIITGKKEGMEHVVQCFQKHFRAIEPDGMPLARLARKPWWRRFL